jgi:hypothetical protein
MLNFYCGDTKLFERVKEKFKNISEVLIKGKRLFKKKTCSMLLNYSFKPGNIKHKLGQTKNL